MTPEDLAAVKVAPASCDGAPHASRAACQLERAALVALLKTTQDNYQTLLDANVESIRERNEARALLEQRTEALREAEKVLNGTQAALSGMRESYELTHQPRKRVSDDDASMASEYDDIAQALERDAIEALATVRASLSPSEELK